MSKQNAFNRVKNHLLKQGEKSISSVDENVCEYRGDNGLKCAIGILIPNSLYHRAMEGDGISKLFVYFPELKKHLDSLYRFSDDNFYSELQCIHDESDPLLWEKGLKRFAIENNLQF